MRLLFIKKRKITFKHWKNGSCIKFFLDFLEMSLSRHSAFDIAM